MRVALDHLVVIIKTESNYLILSLSNLIESMVAKDMGSGGRLCELESHYLITLSRPFNLSVLQFPHYKVGMIICFSHEVIVRIN